MAAKVLHIITGLGQGGAERQVSNLVSFFPRQSAVFSILKPGVMAGEIYAVGVPVYSGGARRPASVSWVSKLRNAIRQFQPDVIMGWMYHGNLAASFSRSLGFKGPVLWNVRHSLHDLSMEKPSTRWVIRANAWWKPSPSRIVYNSVTAVSQHEALGFSSKNRVVIPNGFDLERFKPDQDIRLAVRSELGIPPDRFLLGVVGRYHPMKNHLGWINAFRQLRDFGMNAHCVMVGTGVDDSDGVVAKAVTDAGLKRSVTLLPATQAPEKLYPALDLLIMPSLWGEGFPNVVGEAMACGVPALVTNVGDAAAVVGKTGFVAKEGSPEALALCVSEVLGLGQPALESHGRQARQRMLDEYSLDSVAEAYGSLLNQA